MRLVISTEAPAAPVPAYVAYSYSREWRSWGITLYTAEDDQIGESEWVFGEVDARSRARELGAVHSVQVRKLRAC